MVEELKTDVHMTPDKKSNASNGFTLLNVALAIGVVCTVFIAFSVYNSNIAASSENTATDGDADTTEATDVYHRVPVDDPLFQPLSNR